MAYVYSEADSATMATKGRRRKPRTASDVDLTERIFQAIATDKEVSLRGLEKVQMFVLPVQYTLVLGGEGDQHLNERVTRAQPTI